MSFIFTSIWAQVSFSYALFGPRMDIWLSWGGHCHLCQHKLSLFQGFHFLGLRHFVWGVCCWTGRWPINHICPPACLIIDCNIWQQHLMYALIYVAQESARRALRFSVFVCRSSLDAFRIRMSLLALPHWSAVRYPHFIVFTYRIASAHYNLCAEV